MKVVICMGSSCFARGNGRNLETVERFIAAHGGICEIKVAGSRCDDDCSQGPNLSIDGVAYHRVDSGMLLDLLTHHATDAATLQARKG